jgi:hypothetical protein
MSVRHEPFGVGHASELLERCKSLISASIAPAVRFFRLETGVEINAILEVKEAA